MLGLIDTRLHCSVEVEDACRHNRLMYGRITRTARCTRDSQTVRKTAALGLFKVTESDLIDQVHWVPFQDERLL